MADHIVAKGERETAKREACLSLGGFAFTM